MKLTHVQVQNFRCILDTGKFSISDLCCLVGKNEAGKTATLVAIQSVRPFGNPQTRFDLTEDYPRRFVTRYQERHENLDAPIVKTWWQMNDDGYDKLCAEFGEDAIGSREFMICKNYNQAPFWEFDIDDHAVLASAIKSHRLNASEQASFKQCLSIAEAIDAFKGIERPTAKQQEFAGFLQNFPNSSTSCKAGERVMPKSSA